MAVLNNVDSSNILIRETIAELDRCSDEETCQIAKEIREIISHQYTINSEERGVVKPLNLYKIERYDAQKLAFNISSIAHSELFELRLLVIASVYDAVQNALTKKRSLDELTTLACALDHIGYHHINANDAIYQTIIDDISKMFFISSSRNVQIDVWTVFSLRKVKVEKMSLYHKLANHIKSSANNLMPLEISLAVNGFVQAGFKKPEIFHALRNEAINKSNKFTVNQAVNTLWAYCYGNWSQNKDPSVTRQANLKMIERFTPVFIHQMSDLNVDQTVRIAWVFKNMNVTEPQLFDAVRNKIKGNISLLTPQAFVNITKLLSNINGNDVQVLLQLLETIEKEKFDWFSSEQLTEMAYAVLIKFCYGDSNFPNYSRFIMKTLMHLNAKGPKLTDKELWHIRTIIKIYQAKTNSELHLDNLHAWIEGAQALNFPPSQSSRFHLDVKKHLDELLFERRNPLVFENEMPFEGYFSVDISSTEIMVAIECDGQCHLDESGHYMPKNIIKETLLEINGWNLVRITQNEWPTSDSKKKELLEEKLKKFLL